MGVNGALDGRDPGSETKTTAVSPQTFDTKILLEVLARVAEGDFSARMPLEWTGIEGKAADGINAMVDQLDALAGEAGLYAQTQSLIEEAREVQASADQLELLTNAAPIGIFRTDAEGRFEYTNSRWSELSGISPQDGIGRDWATLIGATEPPGEPLDSIQGNPQGDEFEQRYRLTLPDSTSRIVVMTSEPILTADGEVAGCIGTLADVTAEASAQDERSRFRALIQNSRDVIAVIDESFRCTYVSPGVQDMSGFTQEEVMKVGVLAFVHPADFAGAKDELEKVVFTPGASATLEVRIRTSDERWIWIEVRVANQLEDPAIQGIILNFHDITERRHSVDLLAESETLLAESQSLFHQGSFIWDMRTDELFWSDELYRLLGFEPRSFQPTFQSFLESIHPDDRDDFSGLTRASMETGAPFAFDFRVLGPDGETRWIHGGGEVAMENGEPVRLVGMSHDVTALRDAEEERVTLLAQHKEMAGRLRLLLDSTGEGIFGVDATGACTFMNKAGAALLGGEADDFVGHNMHQLTHHSHADGTPYPSEECPIYRGFLSGEPTDARSEIVWRLDGTSIPVDFSAFPIGGQGSPDGAVVAFQDVTVRQGMEQKVRQSERLFRGAFDAAQTGIALIAADGLTYVDVNRALCEMLGYPKSELLELNWQRITHPDDMERNHLEFAALAEGREDVGYITKRYLRKDGECVSVEISDSVVRGADGSPMYFVTHAHDVTERAQATEEKKKLETQLVQAQKMEAVGLLAGGVAHDFNNILSVILNYAEFASEDLEPGDDRLSDIQEISKAGEKAAKLVHQLLAFSRAEIVEERVIDLNAIVTGVYQILTRSLGEDIDLDLDASEQSALVVADPGRIEQVLLNLAVNARDAMPEGGILKIATGIQILAEEEIPRLGGGQYVVTTVSDSGVGMDESTIDRAFDPFFTTKARGEGTGMGLSTAYGIIDQAGGRLAVESEVGVGTTFSIYLPRSDALVAAAHDEEMLDQAGGTETILLVEDEDAVRELVSRILTKKGYEVIPYSSGPEALEYYRTNFGRVDLLLTDVVMPKMSGGELSEQATSVYAGLETLFMSGYTDALIAQRGVIASGENLITKPFKPEKLLVRIRTLLDRSAAS